MNEYSKPPIGLRPRVAWVADRMLEISQAIQRYTAAFLPIPEGWIAEYNELAMQLGET